MTGEDEGQADEGQADESRKGVGAHLTWIVLGAVLAVVLSAAWRLHAFWWQT